MNYNINDFEDFLKVYKQIGQSSPTECIEQLENNFLGKTFNYYLPSASAAIIKREIEDCNPQDLLFYGSGNGIWLNQLNLPKKFSIIPESKELGEFVQYIIPNVEVDQDPSDKQFDLIIIANSDIEILPILQRKLKPNGKVIFVASEKFVQAKSFLEKRNTLKNYFSIETIYDIGQASMFMLNRVFLPHFNLNAWGNFSLICLSAVGKSTPTIDFYMNEHVKPKENIDKLGKVVIAGEKFQRFSIDYESLGERWDIDYNMPHNFHKRQTIEKSGGVKLQSLCESIIQGLRFYYDSKYISSKFHDYQILNAFSIKGIIEKANQTETKSISNKISPFSIPKNIPTSKPKTKYSWKIAKSIIQEGDIVLSRRNPEIFLLIEKSRENKYIIDDEVVLIRSTQSNIILKFLESEGFKEQIMAFQLNENNMAEDLGELLIPNHLLG